MRVSAIAVMVTALLGLRSAGAADPGSTARYFPLQPQAQWLLVEASTGRQVTMTVVSSDGLSSRVRTRTPWSLTDWVVADRTQRYDLTAYGGILALQPQPDNQTLYRFDAPAGTTWTNNLGAFTITARDFTLTVGGQTYTNCLSIRQATGTFFATSTFAPGAGIVRYSIGGGNFDLDVTRSALPVFPVTAASGPLPPLGVLPNPAAGGPDSEAAASARLNRLSSAGVNFLLSYGSWPQLEPSAGRFDLGSFRYHQSIVSARGWKSGYTLTIINMDRREVPPELQQAAWNSPEMEARVLTLVETLATEFKGRLDYFQFGNEPDTYFTTHPEEVEPFLELFTLVRNRLKTLSPQTAVSITFKQTSLGHLTTMYAALDAACDVLTITYGPYTDALDAKPPSTIAPDFAAIRAAARGRQILFQEIAYPSAAANASSPDQQAQFYRDLLTELRGAGGQVAAVQFFLMSEMSESQTQVFARDFGYPVDSKLETLLGSLGLFDGNHQPKPAWNAIVSEMEGNAAPGI